MDLVKRMYDVIIIGGGPSGLTSAANTSLRGLKSLVIEKQDIPGGLPTLLYPDKIIRDHPGFPVGILGKELSRMLYIQAKNAGAEFKLGEEVLEIERIKDGLIEVKTTQEIFRGKRLILCTGIYNIPKKLDILQSYKGSNIHYKVENPKIFKNKGLLIIGGGDHAFDTAVQLSNFTNNTSIVVKNRYAKAKETTVKLAESLGVKIFYNTKINRILKDKKGNIDRVQIINIETKQKTIISVEHVFIAIGFKPIKIFLEKNGFELLKDGSVKVNRNLETNIKGVFAAGDVTGEVRLIATACAEGIMAAVHAFEAIKKPYWLR
jgi:thioredoxin reductase (NADPH)